MQELCPRCVSDGSVGTVVEEPMVRLFYPGGSLYRIDLEPLKNAIKSSPEGPIFAVTFLNPDQLFADNKAKISVKAVDSEGKERPVLVEFLGSSTVDVAGLLHLEFEEGVSYSHLLTTRVTGSAMARTCSGRLLQYECDSNWAITEALSLMGAEDRKVAITAAWDVRHSAVVSTDK